MIFCKFGEVFMDRYFVESPQTAASEFPNTPLKTKFARDRLGLLLQME